MSLKKRLIKSGALAASVITALCLFTGTCVASSLSYDNPVQAQQSGTATAKLVYLKIKADVAEGFSAPIDISYMGTSGNEFIITLTTDNSYETTIPVVQDAYTLKGIESPAGIDMDIVKNFSLINAQAGNIYILPVSVYQTTPVQGTEEKQVTVSISAKDAATSAGYTGQIFVNYMGTRGGLLSAVLTAENGYVYEETVPADTYSLVSISTENGYKADTAYAFNISAVQENSAYPVTISLEASTETLGQATQEVVITDGFVADAGGTSSGAQVSGSKTCIIHLNNVPSNFKGDVIVTYTGENGHSFSVSLNNANKYTATVSEKVPYDTYSLTKILQTVQSEYYLEAPAIYTVDSSTAGSFVINISVSAGNTGGINPVLLVGGIVGALLIIGAAGFGGFVIIRKRKK